MLPTRSVIAVLALCGLGCAAIADDGQTASKTPAEVETTAAAPEQRVQVNGRTKAVLERVTKHYGPFPGLKVIAKHRIQGTDRVLHEQIRQLDIVKPNRFRVSANERVLAISDGKQCWMLMPDKVGYRELKAAATLPEAIRSTPVLGAGSLGGSGGIVAALLSPNPMATLLRDASRVDVKDMGTDDLLIFEMKKTPGTLRTGTRIGLFIPKTGPAWIAQADIIPPDVPIHTRIVFEKWSPSDSPAPVFELDPQALRTVPLPPTGTVPPADLPESN